MNINKLQVIFLLLVVMSSAGFSLSVQEFLNSRESTLRYDDLNEFRNIHFNDDKTVEFIDDEHTEVGVLWNMKFQYELREKDKLLFLELQIANKSKSYLVLLSDLNLIIYNIEDSKLVFNGVSKGSPEIYFFPVSVVASSELAEKAKTYFATNISNLNLDEPWVEGVKGYGIGETISFSCNAEEVIICPGYISAKKSYLWLQNSRPKNILVTLKKTGKSIKFELNDNPNPQSINFGSIYSGEIEIKILDVYPGTKYDDTCIHSIMLKY